MRINWDKILILSHPKLKFDFYHRDSHLAMNEGTSLTDDDEEDDGSEGSSGSDSDYEDRIKGSGKISQEERKAHKKAVKEAARERRKTKTPKHAKKRAVKKKKK